MNTSTRLLLVALLPLVLVAGCGKSKRQLELEAEAARLDAENARKDAQILARRKAREEEAAQRELRSRQQQAETMEAHKQYVLSRLRDPGSAQFKDLVMVEGRGGPTLCGQLNAKNSMGGYIGFRAFAVTTTVLINASDRLIVDGSASKDSVQSGIRVRPEDANCPKTGA